jgi:signal transduction histidine kinase
MLVYRFYILLLTLFSLPAISQLSPGFRIQQYGTEDGLPSNGIKGLQWDGKTGFLWIATEAGIVRYNGISFKSFTKDDNPNITNERALFLVRNNQRSIFTADNTGNIFTVKENKLDFLFKKKIAGVANSNIITLLVSNNFLSKNHNITNGPFTLQFDKVLPLSDTLTLIIRDNKLYRFSISMASPQIISSIQETIINGFIVGGKCYLLDNKFTVWELNQNNFALQHKPIQFPAGKKPDLSKAIINWQNGMANPIIIDMGNAYKISVNQNNLTAIPICSGVPNNALIKYIQYDEIDNTLFIGTDSKGIIIIRQNKVVPMLKQRTDPKQRTSYYSQYEFENNSVVTNEGHVIGSKNLPLPNAFKQGFSINTHYSPDSVFWFFTKHESSLSCLHSFDKKIKKLTVFPKIKDNPSQYVLTTVNHTLFLANENGIYKMVSDSLQALYYYNAKNKPKTNFSVIEYKPGVLVIANCNALLSYTISTNKLDTIFSSGNYCVRSIWKYNDYLFFGTYGSGFFISKEGKTKQLPLDKNNYLLFTHCFVDDGNGFCWISTNRGLFKISIQEMIAAYESNIPQQVYYHYFGRNDGMEMTEMNGGCAPCAVVLKNNTLSFPTMEGLLWVQPFVSKHILPSGDIFIDEIIIDNKRSSEAVLQQKSLGAFNHDIQFKIGFSAWCNKENIYLEYQLNKKGNWLPVNIETGGSINFNNLPAGSYTIKIRKLNGFGINNYSYKEISFSIAKPWYQRWWVAVFGILFLWGAIVLYFKYRTRKLQQQQKKLELQVSEKTKELQQQNALLEKSNSIKTRLISIISHDIITPLKFLTVAGKNLADKRKTMPDELQLETIQEITNTSQELQMLSTNILNWIKYQQENRRLVKEKINLHETVEQAFAVLKSVASQKGIALINQVDKTLFINQYYEPLKILIYNIVANAINFSDKKPVQVSSTNEAEKVTIHIQDEGVGMSQEQVSNILADTFIVSSANVDNRKGNGLGYLIIKDLVKIMDARFYIHSEKSVGTAVSIEILN